MAESRAIFRKPPVVERRTAAAQTLHRNATAVASLSPARALQQRLGNAGTHALISRTLAEQAPASGSSPSGIQFARVSHPNEPAELEARETARKVVQMGEPALHAAAKSDDKIKNPVVQRDAVSATNAPTLTTTHISPIGGSPLPSGVRNFMEPRFRTNFSNIRVHTGESAAQQSANLNANAFTMGEHVFFGRDKFQPESAGGRELIAHELTHTIQQGAAAQSGEVYRSPDVHVAEQVGSQVQRDFLGIPNPREHFAGKASAIPGFTLLTVVIGFNPITNARVEPSAGNILKGAIQLIPGGNFITDALNNHGVFDKVSNWASAQFEALKDIGSAIWQNIENFIKNFSITDLGDPGALWERAKAIVVPPINRIVAFAKGLKDGIVSLIKEAILKPVAAFARNTSGYPLLCTVMGSDPITGETVPQDADALLGGFMKFIGQEEVWINMQKAKAIPRALAWFKRELNALRGFVNEIPGKFVQAFKSLEIVDIILIPRAFLKLAGVFGDFAIRFVTWGASAVWNLLEIVFDAVSPGAFAYIKKTGGALKGILKNPLPFVGNLVKAAKLGFLNFAGNILEHLKTGLIDWLTGSLPGVYIPKAFSLPEIAKFVFSVLGLSWANIRQKLVKVVGEPAVKAMETGFDIVVTLVRDGPAAAWDKMKEQLSNLKDMVIGGITDFVVDTVVKKAIPKLIAMFIPGAGFISAILSIYDTIMVFVNKISKIAQVVAGFIESIVAIAGGAIGAAATRVENTLAGLLSLAINFLAGFAGLGKVADKVMAVINKVRAPIDKALDWLVNWIVTTAKKLFSKAFGRGKDKDKEKDPQYTSKIKKGLAEIDSLDASYAKEGKISRENAQKVAAKVKANNPVFKSIKVIEGDNTWDYDYVASPGVRYIGGRKGGGQLTVTTVKVKDPGKAAKVEEARTKSGREWELAVAAAVVKEVLVPKWEVTIRVPIEIVVKGQKEFGYPSAQDLARLKVQKGHRYAKDPTRFPDISMEVKKPSGGGALQEVVMVEITLIEDFAATGDFARHKVDQFTYTLKVLKGKYGEQVPITYFFLTPRKPTAETEAFILSTLISEGLPNVKVKWVVVKTK